MTALAVAQRLGLSEAAVAAFSGTGQQFAQKFGRSLSEGDAAVADLPAPNAPTSPVATITDVDEVSLAFTAPTDPGGSPITGYVITSTPSIALTYSDTDVASPIVVTGTFASGVAYTFQIRAVNAAGNGTLSAASAAVTPNP